MNEDDRSSRLFRHEFLDKGLVTFAECSEYYNGLETAELLEEMRVLFDVNMRAIPFAVSGIRYVALLHALIRGSADNRALSDRERSRIVNICIDLCAYIRGRTPEGRRAAYSQALATTLDGVSRQCAYPQVADLVALGTRDFHGPYEPNVVALRRAASNAPRAFQQETTGLLRAAV